ncbi:MAG: hypothetical protein ACI9AQ_001447 [Dinoroseobacter sp.]|jgi:hypothetical protein|tara:strand:+ start:5113 stop:5343 length:231 start_codon:yes stop_codon:yes gene_type:complete
MELLIENFSSNSLDMARLHAICFSIGVQVCPAIDDLTAQTIERGPRILVPPLCKFIPVTEEVEVLVAQNVISVIVE